MKLVCKLLLACIALLLLNACNSGDKFSVLKQCTVLGDESIVYARAHYVKLFYHFNPEKFESSYNQVKNFEAVTLKNTIKTYTRAIEKLATNNVDDPTTKNLLSSCQTLSSFSVDFVENYYRKAFIHNSKNNPLSDEFFIELNQMVKFDHNIGTFDKGMMSFKQAVDNYQKAVKAYISANRKHIPSEFVNGRLLDN